MIEQTYKPKNATAKTKEDTWEYAPAEDLKETSEPFIPDVDFPEVFTNPDFEYSNLKYKDQNQTKRLACSDGLMGWSLCMFGKKPPKNFGIGMKKIEKMLEQELDGRGAIAKTLIEASEKLKKI